MIHPLVRKELREHLWVLIAMWVFCALGLLGLLVSAQREGTPLMAYRKLVMGFGVLLSLALANRFVVREYGGRTQLFLETLPMGRAQVIAVKWLTSTACLLLPMAAGFGITLLAAADKVELTSRFVLIMALRGGVFLLFFHALALLIGLTGRYRYVLWMGGALLVVVVHTLGQLPIDQWPPVQLVSQSLPFEREQLPVAALCITGGATAALVGAAFALALGFQGSWVVALSRRMTLREKVIVTAAMLSVLYVVMQVDGRKPKPAFALQDAVVGHAGTTLVSVARAASLSDAAAGQLAQRMAADIEDVRGYLALTELPAVAILPDAAVDADQFLLAKLPKSDGVVARAALGAEQFDESAFRTFVVARVIDWHSRGRAMREQRRWLLDGFSWWRVAQADAGRRDLLTLRAAVAADVIAERNGSLAQALQNWSSTREELGECLADALAWRTTAYLALTIGEERFRKVAHAQLGVRSRPDVRAFLTDRSLNEQLQEAGGPSMDTLAQQLGALLLTERKQLATIPTVPRWPVKFTAVPMRGSTYELQYEVSAPLGEAQPFAVRYARLGPWQGEVPRADMARVDAVGSGVLPASFPRGTQLLAAVEMQDPQLGCAIRLGARRWEIQ